MTCKDCVHYEVCEDVFLKRRIEVGKLRLCDCYNFIPKSRYVELPCEVGQTLYFFYDNRYANKPDQKTKIYETKDWYFDIDEKGTSILPRNIHGYKGKYHYHLNETVFLSREKAEKALKERDQE